MYDVKDWALAYANPLGLLQAHFSALDLLNEVNLLDLPAELPEIESINTEEDAQKFADAIWAALENFLKRDPDIVGFDDDDAEEARMATMPEEEKSIYKAVRALALSTMFVVVFNYFACMKHRKAMPQLVEEAKGGNFDSFLKAIQTDKSCLTTLPCFRDIVVAVVASRDRPKLDRMMDWYSKPAFQGAVKLTGLYFVLSFLQWIGLLDEFERDPLRFAEMCQSLGVYGPQDTSVDVVDSFTRAVRRFKEDFTSPSITRKGLLVLADTISP